VRIVAGKFRRRRLLSSPGDTTRPITDRVKETLFERLTADLIDRRVADVFAGTGTLGLEALSRGAKSVVFIERDRIAFDLLQQNVATLGAADQTLCWRTDAFRTSYRPKGVSEFIPFEVVFFDPPYRMIANLKEGSLLYSSLERLARPDVTAPGALLILRTPERASFSLPSCWLEQSEFEYSTMQVHLYRKQEAQP
jgi:16S rRNA (guanine966-N2)-methyltransferase